MKILLALAFCALAATPLKTFANESAATAAPGCSSTIAQARSLIAMEKTPGYDRDAYTQGLREQSQLMNGCSSVPMLKAIGAYLAYQQAISSHADGFSTWKHNVVDAQRGFAACAQTFAHETVGMQCKEALRSASADRRTWLGQ